VRSTGLPAIPPGALLVMESSSPGNWPNVREGGVMVAPRRLRLDSVVLLGALLLASVAAADIVCQLWIHSGHAKKGDERLCPLRATPAVYDFGRVREGIRSASFSLTNATSVPVHVASVHKSCSCAEVRVPNETIEPADSVPLHCEWDLRGDAGMTRTDLIVYVASERSHSGKAPPDSELTRLRLGLRADVVPAWRIVPDKLLFREGVRTLTAIVEPVAASEVSLVSASCAHDAFRVSVDVPANRVRVSFDSEKWLLPGPVDVLIETDSKMTPRKRLPLSVVATP
jgi:hypothetical protein